MHSLVFCCNLQTRVLSAAHCKHVRFSVTKRTGYHASSHIITSYVLKRNRKQANPKESRALFGVWAGRAGWKMTFFLNASLERHSCKSGSIPPLEIIPHRFFQQIGMHFPAGNHPSQTFLANQDAFLQRESSLPEISSRSGCISLTEIISPRHFQQIRMHFPAGNHPSQTFLANQDAFLRWKSSPTGISCKSGCIPSLEIIPPRHFLQIRMNFLAGNHPSQTFPANQDESPRKKSSLDEYSCKSGCISAAQKASLKNHPQKASPQSLQDRQNTLDKGYNSFREKFNGIRTPNKKLMKNRKDRNPNRERKNPKALCTLTPSLSQVGARSSYFCHPENAGQAGVFCP